MDFDSFEDRFDSKVSLSEGNSLLARLGVSGDRRDEWQAQDKTRTRSLLQVTLDVYQELGDGRSVDVAEVN
ncbi:autotransporter outer membrane beta-barrel domain-containing protein, partial [Priestia aryabhattai]